jgi:hypothetical protein
MTYSPSERHNGVVSLLKYNRTFFKKKIEDSEFNVLQKARRYPGDASDDDRDKEDQKERQHV